MISSSNLNLNGGNLLHTLFASVEGEGLGGEAPASLYALNSSSSVLLSFIIISFIIMIVEGTTISNVNTY